jgi:hypothetical protein
MVIKKMLSAIFIVCLLCILSSPSAADVSVVIFSKTTDSLNGVTYTVSGTGVVHHTICDLDPASGPYDVRQNGVLLSGISPIAVPPEQVITFDSSGAGIFAISPHTGGGGDVTPPSGTIIIDNNAAYTRSTTVTLSLSAVDTGIGMGPGAEMRFSNDNVNWSSPEPYAASRQWSLSAGDGAKRVYALYKDAAGNWMPSAVNDSIILDTILPTASIASPANGANLNMAAVTVKGAASDANGVASVSVNGVSAQSDDNFAHWTAAVPLSEGGNTISVTARDNAGNTRTGAASITVNVDTTPPSPPAMPIINGN